MIACVDVSYRDHHAVAACVILANWGDDHCVDELVTHVKTFAPYQPGRFYKRELRPLLQVLHMAAVPLKTVVIDGYVWLSAEKSPGLGAHLYQTLVENVPVIGVAKSRFKDAAFAYPLLRGNSRSPLYITAAGMNPEIAAGHIWEMHGKYRIPTMLTKVDRLCRNG